MEANIRATLARGDVLVDFSKLGPPQEPLSPSATACQPLDSYSQTTNKPPSVRIRTISTMDEDVLKCMETSTNVVRHSQQPQKSTESLPSGVPLQGRPPLPQRSTTTATNKNSKTMDRESSSELSVDSLTLSPDATNDAVTKKESTKPVVRPQALAQPRAQARGQAQAVAPVTPGCPRTCGPPSSHLGLPVQIEQFVFAGIFSR